MRLRQARTTLQLVPLSSRQAAWWCPDNHGLRWEAQPPGRRRAAARPPAAFFGCLDRPWLLRVAWDCVRLAAPRWQTVGTPQCNGPGFVYLALPSGNRFMQPLHATIVCPHMPSARPAARQRNPAPPAGTSHTITDLALEFDITARAIRFYEDMGLLAPARAGRNRVYTQRDRIRLKLTLRGKRLGLSLLEIKQLVDMYDSPADTAPQLTAFLGVLGEHRRLLEQQREDIDITLAEVTQHEQRCRTLLDARQQGPQRARPRAASPVPTR